MAEPSKKERVSVEPYKGVRDFYPEEQALLNYIFSTWRAVAERMGYVEYHASILEPAELYRTKTSEEIVNEQTYTFEDRGGREVTLRPEMTPTVARMVAARRREFGFPLRLFSIPNVFRYERPQRGRLREHWQFNLDLFGARSDAADAEIISVAHKLMSVFGGSEDDFVIKVGSRAHLDSLADELGLSAEQYKRLLGLLDRRAKMPENEFDAALAALGVPARVVSSNAAPAEIATLLHGLRNEGINNVVYDSTIIRGFQYYTGMVFEVFDTHPENNRALCGGGRYDNLFSLFGEENIPTVGFAMGDVALREFLAVRKLLPAYRPPTHVYIAIPHQGLAQAAQAFAGELRAAGVNVAVDFGEKKLAEQIKAADKHQIPYLIVVGENELASGQFVVRDLTTGEEKTLDRAQLAEFFLNV